MTSQAIYAVSRRIDVERGRLERLAINAAARTGQTALMHARAALRLGSDPVGAARDVLVGNAAIRQPGLEELLARMLVTAYLLGLRRTVLSAQQRLGRTIEFSRAGDKLDSWFRKLAETAAVAESEVAGLFARARTVAARMIRRMTDPLLRRIGAFAGAVAESDAASKVVEVREVATQFEKAGFVAESPHGIAPELSAGVVRAYESGRRRGWREPAVWEKLWGFRYSAVLDSRTTRICRGLDGTVLPKDDPFFEQWTPPNHYNCRSCVIEVWQSAKLREPTIVRGYERFGDDFFIG